MLEARYIDVAELQQYMNIGRSKAYWLCQQKGFPAIRVGSKILIDKDKLDKLDKNWTHKKTTKRGASK